MGNTGKCLIAIYNVLETTCKITLAFFLFNYLYSRRMYLRNVIHPTVIS